MTDDTILDKSYEHFSSIYILRQILVKILFHFIPQISIRQWPKFPDLIM